MSIDAEHRAHTHVPAPSEMIARAEALVPRLRERAADAEKNRRLSDDTVAEFRAAGFHKILQPKQFGGLELGLDVATSCIRTLASACGSSGWIANLFIVHNYQLGLFPLEAQREYWGAGDDQVCSTVSFAPRSDALKVEGGYRLSGR
jgi:3-hydroxy-9,10-secoandrosta-1,3,5(10)-triene-9,17-dione monooxygenase